MSRDSVIESIEAAENTQQRTDGLLDRPREGDGNSEGAGKKAQAWEGSSGSAGDVTVAGCARSAANNIVVLNS